ncbi:signal peptidase I [Chitinivibrio alkaliphilus]|uniref:Signal peptidase I n=1 Tax=Chitinivibrio alkaliphilus ACht1 TaxID=1313304 RepID=U7D5H9_9BACT|nr:signal peptidase I [Chitinivibrio alkaliphilus]ERP31213.1 signal peptidase I [Chitinivibrio alkaliphilus ACht1]
MTKSGRRGEKEGILNFSKEMISALATALIFIIYVIQAFTIPTKSMEGSLLAGDFLLGLKFVYGAPVIPFTYLKFPGIRTPQRGDVVIFKYPGPERKDYIKRFVAVAGDTVWFDGADMYINSVRTLPPDSAQFLQNGQFSFVEPYNRLIEEFDPLYIPGRGDTLDLVNAPLREFLFYKRLIHQENPRKRIRDYYTFKVNGDAQQEFGNQFVSDNMWPYDIISRFRFSSEWFDLIDQNPHFYWFNYVLVFEEIEKRFSYYYPDDTLTIGQTLTIDGTEIQEYVVQNDNYFAVGDNRDNSSDSRFWGFVNDNFVKAQAFIIYFSLEEDVPWFLLPAKIRWNRLGSLIRSWDGYEAALEDSTD